MPSARPATCRGSSKIALAPGATLEGVKMGSLDFPQGCPLLRGGGRGSASTRKCAGILPRRASIFILRRRLLRVHGLSSGKPVAIEHGVALTRDECAGLIR